MRVRSHDLPWFPLTILGVLVACAVFAPYLSPQSPTEGDITTKLIPPMWMERGTSEHPLGTDRFGRELNGEVVATRITQDGIRAHARAVNGTPSFFVNGKEAKDQSWSPEGLRQMINAALREAGK